MTARQIIVFLALLVCGAVGRAATRVALVSAGGDAEIQKVQDTAPALLSKDTGLEMVERAEINRVLQEQSLSLAGVDQTDAAVQAGTLLHADLFTVLENSVPFSSAPNQPLALVVFDARTGVRYADAVLSASNPLPSASAVSETLRAAVAKSRQPAAQLHTVCLLLVRNADLPAEYNRLCDSVGPLLERELTSLPDVVVLERGRLAHVHQEQQITGEDNQLLSSLQMLELDISRDGDGLRGLLRAVAADDTRTSSVAVMVPARDPASLARALAQKSGNLLSAPVTTFKPQDRVAEAGRFHREMKTLQEQKEYLGALRAMEAAYALAPGQPGYAVDMVYGLCDGATEYFAPGTQRGGGFGRDTPKGFTTDLPSAIYLGNRAADLLIDSCREFTATNQPGNPVPDFMLMEGQIQLRGMLSTLIQVQRGDDLTKGEIMAIVRKERMLLVDVKEPFWRKRATNLPFLGDYARQFAQWFARPGYERVESREWQENKALILGRFFDTAREVNPPDGSGIYLSLVNEFLYEPGLPIYSSFVKTLEHDADPVTRLNAQGGLLALNKPEGNADAATVTAVREFRLRVQDSLANEFSKEAGPRRNAVWEQLEEGLRLVDTGMPGIEEYLEASRFAIKEGDFRYNLFRQTVSGLQSGHRDSAEQLEVVDGVLDLLKKNPDAFHNLAVWPTTLGRPSTNDPAAILQRDRNRFIADFQRFNNQLTTNAVAVSTNLPGPSTTWKSATKLADLYKPVDGFHWLFRPVVKDDNAYLLQLVCIPLNGGRP